MIYEHIPLSTFLLQPPSLLWKWLISFLLYVEESAQTWIDKSLSCLSEKKAADQKSALIYCTSSFCVMFNSGRNNLPLCGRQNKRRRLWDKPHQCGLVFCCRCQGRPASDPDIKGLKKSFPPFKAWTDVPAPKSLIFPTSLLLLSRNYTPLQYLSPLVRCS